MRITTQCALCARCGGLTDTFYRNIKIICGHFCTTMKHLTWMTSNHYAVLCIVVDVLGSCLLLEIVSYFLTHSFVEHLCMFIIVGAVSVLVNEKHPVRKYMETVYEEKLRTAVDKIQTVFEGKIITLQIENSKQKAILEHRENVHGRKDCSDCPFKWVVNSESSKSTSNTHPRRHHSKSPVMLPPDPAMAGFTKHSMPPALGPYSKSIDLCTPSLSLAGSSHTSQNSSHIHVEKWIPSSRSLDPYELETSLQSQGGKFTGSLKGKSEEIQPLSRGL